VDSAKELVMSFEVHLTQKRAGDRIGDVYELIDTEGQIRAEVWPHWGLNCLRWQIRRADGHWADIFYVSPDWDYEPIPTRNGHAVLFPFPGRLREGRFNFQAVEYQLPLNDATRHHAIHGFTPRHRWRIADWNSDRDCAFVTGECILAEDMPEVVHLWPANFKIQVTYRLSSQSLHVEASVTNIDDKPLPFGLGYHPYFCLPGVQDPDIDHYQLQIPAAKLWHTGEDLLPTGERQPVPELWDFRREKCIGDARMDLIFTDLTSSPAQDKRRTLAQLSHKAALGRVEIRATPNFRELVVFTPPHRQAIALEPYTCVPDAANLALQHSDTGWIILKPHEKWEGVVEYRWSPATL
jgi:aldose 1-epimerase